VVVEPARIRDAHLAEREGGPFRVVVGQRVAAGRVEVIIDDDVVPGRWGFGFWARLGPTTAALGPPTSVGAVCSLQATRSAVSAEVVIKRRCIGLSHPEFLRRTLIPVERSAYHVFPLTCGCTAWT